MTGLGDLWLELGIFAGLIVLSAYFAGAETALTAASKARMHALEENGNAQAKLVNKLREKKDMLIGGLLLGNNLVNIFASAFATSVSIRLFGEGGVVVATIFVTFMVLVFGEVMPKTYALLHTDRTALFMARPVSIVVALFSPVTAGIVKIVNALFALLGVDASSYSQNAQTEELRGAIALFRGSSLEEAAGDQMEQGAMLRSILDLADVHVEEIMIHRKDVQMLDADWSADKIVDEVLQSPYTRLPVWQDSPDNIIGIVHAKLVLSELRDCEGDIEQIDVVNLMMPPWFIPETATLLEQLQAFRQRREHFAVMVDEYGAFRGVITLEDILEEIVGEIDDEHDTAVSGIVLHSDGHYIVEGKVTIRDINRELEWRLPDEDYATVAGLLLFESQRIPAVGQTYTFHGFRFKILEKNRNQIVSVSILPPDKVDDERDAAS